MFQRFLRPRRNDSQAKSELDILRASTLLDPIWYRKTYPDLHDAPVDVAQHYIQHGAAEGRNPGPNFDTLAYIAKTPELINTGENPLVHFIRTNIGGSQRELPVVRPADGVDSGKHFDGLVIEGETVFDEIAYATIFPDIEQAFSSADAGSMKRHYDTLGADEISNGTRVFLSKSENQDLRNILPICVRLTARLSWLNQKPWSFLGVIDRDFMDNFVFVLFEHIYLTAFPDLREAVSTGHLTSGIEHWLDRGRSEIAGGGRHVPQDYKFSSLFARAPLSGAINPLCEDIFHSIRDWNRLFYSCATADITNIEHILELPRHNSELLRAVSDAYSTITVTRNTPMDFGVNSVITNSSANAFYFNPKIIAFYLPQYHRVKENDEFWGEGFTEWSNVKKARPNFHGHLQPHVPLNEDYYDLSDVNVQRRQTRMAREYGIAAFCYYLYWFDGKRVLEKPLDQMLEDKTIDHEYCLCWANENWTRTWDGKAHDVLIGQIHTPASDRRFIRDIMKYFRDPRYLRVDGNLVLLVYRVDLLPNCRETANIWRQEVRDAGLGELHLCAVQFYGVTDPEPWGFDAAVEFPPHGWLVPENKPHEAPTLLNENFIGHIFDYEKSAHFALRKPIPSYRWYRGVFPGWDNTARRQDTSHIFANSDPFKFEAWILELIRQTVILAPTEHQLIFVNAWNEWGEGAHLEPDAKHQFLYLMALNSAISAAREQAWPLAILNRLRNAGSYNGRDADERALLNMLRGYERGFNMLLSQLNAIGRNPFL